jgi:predicted acetyltransferase
VRAALEGRLYAGTDSLVVEVRDERVAANDGRWRLDVRDGEATVAPTADPADLALGIAPLSSAYLGGTSLVELADAGLVDERTSGAAARATALLRSDRAPWCPEIF